MRVYKTFIFTKAEGLALARARNAGRIKRVSAARVTEIKASARSMPLIFITAAKR